MSSLLGKQEQACKQEQKFLLLCIQCYPETSQRPLLQNIPKSGLTMGSNSNYLRRNLEKERTWASSLLGMVSKANENDTCNPDWL